MILLGLANNHYHQLTHGRCCHNVETEGEGAPQTPAVAGFPWQLEVEDLDPEEAAGGSTSSLAKSMWGLSSGERPRDWNI